jgi:hypothetical protein
MFFSLFAVGVALPGEGDGFIGSRENPVVADGGNTMLNIVRFSGHFQ